MIKLHEGCFLRIDQLVAIIPLVDGQSEVTLLNGIVIVLQATAATSLNAYLETILKDIPK